MGASRDDREPRLRVGLDEIGIYIYIFIGNQQDKVRILWKK